MYSLPDWAFYPLAALLIGGMIYGALSGADNTIRSNEDILAEGVAFEGDQLNGITLGNGLDAVVLVENDRVFARISAARGPLDGPQSAGAFYTLTPQEIEAMQGHVVQVSFRVRSAGENGASGVNLALFVAGIGQDAWQRQAVTTEFADYSMTITPPPCDWGYGYLGLWPDWTVGTNTIDVDRVEIRVLEAQTC
jgi:hypothetical protein